MSRKLKFKSRLTEQSLNRFFENKFFYLDQSNIDLFVMVDPKDSSFKYISNYFGLEKNKRCGVMSVSNDGPLEYHLVDNA